MCGASVDFGLYTTKIVKICYAFMQLNLKNMRLKQVLCNYLNKQNYLDFFVLMTLFLLYLD